ncbi:MAG: nickel-responsive transcriptional regulator NikR [Zoogloeaceae bacterium]|jgi:CopG family nickel-responsive transcriptional regulator|nr:nickel-responsive transcriptional regulator NikR [Zoogloeaceae bacterium]
MERFTISLDEQLAKEFDRLIRERGYSNRSEAVRDILREKLEAGRLAREEAPDCIAALSYIYNHHERDLAERLTVLSHGHHDLTVSTMHAHLDHDHCLETMILRGPTKAVRAFADSVTAERGVRHGALNLVPADLNPGHVHHHHDHHHGPDHPYHVHSRPKS